MKRKILNSKNKCNQLLTTYTLLCYKTEFIHRDSGKICNKIIQEIQKICTKMKN